MDLFKEHDKWRQDVSYNAEAAMASIGLYPHGKTPDIAGQLNYLSRTASDAVNRNSVARTMRIEQPSSPFGAAQMLGSMGQRNNKNGIPSLSENVGYGEARDVSIKNHLIPDPLEQLSGCRSRVGKKEDGVPFSHENLGYGGDRAVRKENHPALQPGGSQVRVRVGGNKVGVPFLPVNAGNGAIVPRGNGGKAKRSKFGYGARINLDYNVEDDYEVPGYAYLFDGNVLNESHGYHGSFASGNFCGGRKVSKENHLAAEAVGLQSCLGGGLNNDTDGVKAVIEGNVVKAEAHAGPIGVGVRGPEAACEIEAGKKGLKINAGYERFGGKVSLGPFEVGVGIGDKVVVRVNSSGIGAIFPWFGGCVVADDGVEVSCGRVNFYIIFPDIIKKKLNAIFSSLWPFGH